MNNWLKQNFFVRTYRNIRGSMPSQYFNSLYKNIIAALIRAILDVLGIFVLLPVMNILLVKNSIRDDSWTGKMYNFFHCSTKEEFALILMLFVVLIFVVKTWLSWLIIRFQNRFFGKVTEEISMGVYLSYLNESYDFHVNSNTGILVRNFISVPFEFTQRILMPFVQLISEMMVIIILCSVLLVKYLVVLLFLLLFMLPFGYLYYRFTRLRLSKLSSRRDTQGKLYYTRSFQDMNIIREILLFKRFEYFKRKYHDKLVEIVHNYRSLNVMNDFSLKLIELMAVVGIFVIFIALLLLHKSAELAEILVFYVIVLSRIIPSLNKTIMYMNTIKSTEYAFNYIKDLPKDINADSPSRIQLEALRTLSFNKKISFKNLYFKYPSATKPALDNISFDVQKGETVGIVGPSGSGKTTLLNVLLRLYQESDGGLFVDNEKITNENLSSWYDLIGYVPQNIQIIDSTIIENIAFGISVEDINEERVNAVIKQAKLEELVTDAENGLQTQIGEQGLKISGGQRQRIGIARALYMQPKILIFDEATSALDAQTEEAITESIRELSHKDMTIIIVAHRVPTLRYCDRIIVIENGKTKEEVSYETLRRQSGL